MSGTMELSGLTSGSHTLRVIGHDHAGNITPVDAAASFTWTVLGGDTPVATLLGVPTEVLYAKSISITVGGTDVVAYKMSYNGGAFSGEININQPIAISNLRTGSHTISVYGKSASGVWQEVPTTATWVVANSPTRKVNLGAVYQLLLN